jgi:chromosome segregation ATPase
MSFMGRAFGARDRRNGNGTPPLEKVLADLHEGEQEYDPYTPAIEPRESTPPPTAPLEGQNHRERLEKLLNDARRISQMLEKEAAEAALAENLKLDEKLAAVAKLATAEAEAEAHARALAQQSESAAMHRTQIDTEVRAAQQAVSAAEDSVKQLEARLAEAQNVVIQAKSTLGEIEDRTRHATLEKEANEAKVHETDARVTKCREAREAAEAEVWEAKAFARSIMQTAATLKQLRAPKLVVPTGIEPD